MADQYKAIKRAAARYAEILEQTECAYAKLQEVAEMNGYTVNKETGRVTKIINFPAP